MCVQPAQALRQRGSGFWRQVVDADVLDPVQRKGGLEAFFVGRPQWRHVLQRETRAGTEGTHPALADKSLSAGLYGFHRERGLAPRLGLISKAAVACHLVPFQARVVSAVCRTRQRLCRAGTSGSSTVVQPRPASASRRLMKS